MASSVKAKRDLFSKKVASTKAFGRKFDKNYKLGMICANPILDVQGQYLVSINDQGQGQVSNLCLGDSRAGRRTLTDHSAQRSSSAMSLNND